MFEIRRKIHVFLILAIFWMSMSHVQIAISSPCNVTVAAHDNAIGSDIEINFQVNGNKYITPYNVSLNIGSHSFSFPEMDSYGYPFKHCTIWYSDGSHKYISSRIFNITITFLNDTDFTLKAYYHREPYSDKHPTVIYVDMPIFPVGVNENFSINIVVFNVKDLYAWELVAFYPKNVMGGLSINDAAFLNRIEGAPWIFLVDGRENIGGYCTYPFTFFGPYLKPYDDYNVTHGYVHCGSTIINSIKVYTGVTGSGIIVSIKGSPFNTFLLNSDLEEIPLVVTIIGDVSGSKVGVSDSKVDMKDVAIVSRNFGMNEEKAGWDPFYDITGPEYLSHDCVIDMRDVALVSRNFGRYYE